MYVSTPLSFYDVHVLWNSVLSQNVKPSQIKRGHTCTCI